MMAPYPVASRSPDRTGVRCPGQGAPSARETTIGQGFPSPYQPDKGRCAIYRTDLAPNSRWYALCATIVGNRWKPSGESRFKLAGTFRRLASLTSRGVAEAHNILGFMYEQGQGVPKDDAEALRWLRNAAAQGNRLARDNGKNMKLIRYKTSLLSLHF